MSTVFSFEFKIISSLTKIYNIQFMLQAIFLSCDFKTNKKGGYRKSAWNKKQLLNNQKI